VKLRWKFCQYQKGDVALWSDVVITGEALYYERYNKELGLLLVYIIVSVTI
jgi:hypothetical protein